MIAGANGFLGRLLSRYFFNIGYEVVALVRAFPRESEEESGGRSVLWDGKTLDPWVAELEGARALVNLAGRSVNCRYGQKNRDEILRSRIDSTEILGAALRECAEPPRVWVNSSTATIYRHAEDRAQTEARGEIGHGFSVEVALAWEKAFFQAQIPAQVRKMAMRTAIVLANESGSVFDYLFKLSRLGLGGKMGNGQQRVSWLAGEDFCRAVAWLIEHEEADGIYNVVAPEAVKNEEFMAEFRRLAGRNFGLPASRWMLEIGAFFLRTETELILKSRWVKPQRLLKEGFQFRWPELRSAMDGFQKKRSSDSGDNLSVL